MTPVPRVDTRVPRNAVLKLLKWFAREARDLPWRRVRTPYTTWVSEIMLQQTTATVAAPRFEMFLAEYPDLQSLAAASEEAVVAAWAGLGYYSRARSLHRGARLVMADHGGVIPKDEDALLALPGVGPYTASALRALAFGQRAVPVDGNVARVLARFQGDAGDIGSIVVKRRLAAGFEGALPEKHAAAAAEALIELGALICRPRNPDCPRCPLVSACRAHEDGRTGELPVKRATRASIAVRSVRAVVTRRKALLLVLRPDDISLLPGFWELPGAWVTDDTPAADILVPILEQHGLVALEVGEPIAHARHTITHHRIRAEAHAVRVMGRVRGRDVRFVSPENLDLSTITTESRKLLRETPFGAARQSGTA